jgi:hypothetical protein
MSERNKNIAMFEIYLLIMLSVSFAFLISENNSAFANGFTYEKESEIFSVVKEMFYDLMSKGLVSAQSGGLWTCLEDNDGTICQEYPVEDCNDLCAQECFPGLRQDYSECTLGTCLDPQEGTCTTQTPQFACEEAGGTWSETSPAACNPICCLYGDQSIYTTEIACNGIEQTTGIDVEIEQVSNELECLVLASSQVEGACVVESEGLNECGFVGADTCLQMGGEFYEGFLCSHPELNTVCEKQDSVSCVDGKDELYWFDSCGNRENIYSANKAQSWNGGVVQNKADSCSVETGNNPLGSQSTCGNCNRFTGSVCGDPGPSDDHIVDSNLGDFVCRDVSCIDEWGDRRENGESWCTYESSIGVQGEGNQGRSSDVPGSRHYRRFCRDGQVKLDSCQDFRNEVCVESVDEESQISSAACVLNEWQLCIEANTDEDKFEECEKNDFCYYKKVAVDEGFTFDVCAPKYPAGFDLKRENGGESAQLACSLGTQECTAVFVKKLSGSWKCESNCECLTPVFTESMNNLCMSLGDCGASYTLTEKYADEGASPGGFALPLGDNYKLGLKSYIDDKKGQRVELDNIEGLIARFGITAEPGTPEYEDEVLELIGTIGGGVGTLLPLIAQTLPGAIILNGLGIISAKVAVVEGAIVINPGLSAGGSAVLAAIIGAAVVSLLIQYTGVGAGLDPAVVYSLVATGAYTAFFATAGYYGLFDVTYFCFDFLVCALAFIVLVIVIVIFSALGIGDTKERTASFECLPWQPPRGGTDCGECDDEEVGIACSKYKCQSLGQTCEFINEGSGEEECIDVNPNDVAAPKIAPWQEPLSEGFEYEEVGNNGFRIARTDDECIPSFTPITFGVKLDEPASCKWSFSDEDSYDNMPNNFLGGSNLLKDMQAHFLYMPSLQSLGVVGIDPERFGDFRLSIRCSDANGNSNTAAHLVEFCVSPEPDNTPPIIRSFIPESESFVEFNAIEKEIDFFVNEPAECKWDQQDIDYEFMNNVAECENDISDITLLGFRCSTTLPIVEGVDENKFYFRCEDQPWLEGEETEEDSRNVNVESFEYVLKRSVSDLSIDFVSPDDITLVGGSAPVPFDLEVWTSGGANGDAVCSFSINSAQFSTFRFTGGDTHRQELSSGLFPGDQNINYECVDVAGNTAEAESEFTIEVDDNGPSITHVFDFNGVLTVITDEFAECAYSFESCAFSFSEGELMTGSNQKHTTALDQSLTHYVKCEDGFGNSGLCLTIAGGF